MLESGWRKSSFSEEGGNNCLELANDDDSIVIRESTEPDAVLTTDRTALRAFVLGVKTGHFDRLLNR